MAVDKIKNEDLSNMSAKELKEMADKLLAEAEADSAPADKDKGDSLSVDDYIEEFTLIEMAPKILNGVCQPNRIPLMHALDKNNVHINVNTKVLEVTDSAVKVQR